MSHSHIVRSRGMDPRTKAIDDVREIFSRAPSGPPPRVCPSCGAEHATNRAECPSCGKRYDRRFARVSDTQRWILAGLALAGVIAAAVLILPGVFSAKRDNDARVAREHAARVAAERRRLIREQRPMRGRPAHRPPAPPPARAPASRSRRATSSSSRSRARSSPTPCAREERRARRPGQARELRAR